MKKTQRILLQMVIWTCIAFFFCLVLGDKRAPVFLLSVFLGCYSILLLALVYVFAPRYLFKGKYVVFILVSLTLFMVTAQLLVLADPGPGMHRPELPSGFPPPGMPRPPSRGVLFSLVLLVAYAVAAFVEGVSYAQKKAKEAMASKNEQLQTELKFLRSQINPHFLFNALNNIYALSVLESHKTPESIGHLSDMLRYVLYDCEQQLVPIKKELTYIKNFFKLFALKRSEPFPITRECMLEDDQQLVAPMLFIPFIENALKHSYIEQVEDSFIDVKLEQTSDMIYFEIRNSLSRKHIQKDEVGGIGIENVKRRLAIIYPNKHQLHISESDAVFSVILKIQTL
mgnify:CR=1 FL=1